MNIIIIFIFFSFSVLIEKILRAAPEVGKIFLLIRAESEEAASKRLKDEVCWL